MGMTTKITIHLMISLVMFLNTSTSAPTACKCINPFRSTAQSFIGDPALNCNKADGGICFVTCGSGCKDERPAIGVFGEGKCMSTKIACDLYNGKTVEKTGDETDAKFSQKCKGSQCLQTNVINLKIVNTQNCLTSNCQQTVQG